MKNNVFLHCFILALTFTILGMVACSENTPSDDQFSPVLPDSPVPYSVPLAEWGMAVEDVVTHMDGYVKLSQTSNSLFYTGGTTPELTYAFQFNNGLLSASTIIMPATDLSMYVGEYTHIGLIGKKDIYTNTSLNTIATLYQALDADSSLCAVGFLPIESSAYEELSTPEVTTNVATIIDYSSAEVSGSVSGLQANDSYGIIFGNESSLSDGIQLKSNEGRDFSFTLTHLDMEKTYYYCAYAEADGITYYGQTLSFAIPTPDIKVTTGEAEDVASFSAIINGSANISLQFDAEYDYGFFLSKTGTPTEYNHVVDTKPDVIQIQNFTATLNNLNDNTTYYFCAYVLCEGRYFYGSTKSFQTPKATMGTLAGHDWVDLDLPSGLKWATCNVGASVPEQYGGYYAWGETSTKSGYYTNNYPYGNTNTHSYNIPYDISGTSYDVARRTWGSTWQMPTFYDIRELYNYCTFSWESVNGVYGAKITGSNGNSIFLPAGGGIGPGFSGSNGTTVVGKGVYGRYWSSNMAYKQNWNEVKYLFFKQEGIQLTTYFLGSSSDMNTNGFNGLLVRPVTK